MEFKQRMKRFSQRYQQFVEKQGFPIIMTACIAVIVLTAVWSGRMDETIPAPTPPVDQAQSAAQLEQQSLSDVQTPAPAPSPTPAMWSQPLAKLTVLRGFDATRMTQSAVTGIWQLHDAVDLAADMGEIVFAIADGVVIACVDDGIQGAAVTIDHGSGVVSYYASLAQHAGLRPGDPVSAGQTIGFAGNGLLGETDLGPHLHLRVTRDNHAVDPLLLR